MTNTRGDHKQDLILRLTGPAHWFDVPHHNRFRGTRLHGDRRNYGYRMQENETIELFLKFSTPPRNGTPWFCIGNDSDAHTDIHLNSTTGVSGCHLQVGFDDWGQIVIRDTSFFVSEVMYTQLPHANSTRIPRAQQHESIGNQTDPPQWVVPVGWMVTVIFSEVDAEIAFQAPDHSRDIEEYQWMVREFQGDQKNPMPFLGGIPPDSCAVPIGAISPTAERNWSETRNSRHAWIVSDKKLGSGSDAQVFEVFKSSNWARCAGKRVRDDEKFQLEYASMSMLEHRHIARYIDIQNMQGPHQMIIMEYCSMGALDKQRRFNEGEIRKIMTQAFSAIAYLHSKNITHRDIKPANILIRSLEPLEIAVSDFGSSKQGESPMETLVGTYYYMAPEVMLLGEPDEPSGSNTRYNNKSDIWSLGVTAIQLIRGQLPMLKDQGDFDMRYPVEMSKSCRNFLLPLQNRDFAHLISKMLSWYPEDRPTAAECFERASAMSRGSVADFWARSYDSALGGEGGDLASTIRPVKRQASDFDSAAMPRARMMVDTAAWSSSQGLSDLLERGLNEVDGHRIEPAAGEDDVWATESEDFEEDESFSDDSESFGDTDECRSALTSSF